MHDITHVTISGLLVLLPSALVASPAAAQTAAYNNDISGHWATLVHEDNPERGTGPSLSEYQGLAHQ
jgi:hypothetical protein